MRAFFFRVNYDEAIDAECKCKRTSFGEYYNMTSYKLSHRSIDRLSGVHPLLVKVVSEAIKISAIDFSVIEGARTLEKQKEYVAAGKSKTLNSYHIPRMVKGIDEPVSCAVDLAAIGDGTAIWDRLHYYPIAYAIRTSACKLGVKITWGGDWRTFKDYVHFQIEVEE